MTLSFNQLTQFLVLLLGRNRQNTALIQKLNLSSLSEEMLRDLNLPPDVKGRLEAQCELEKFRRRHFI
jgi:hypothetical protein